jgi:hypothetical protein
MSFEYDESKWPLVLTSWRGTPSDEEFGGMLSRVDGWLARGEVFALLVDARGVGGFSPEQRRRLISHMKENAALSRRYLVQAAVIDGLMQRTLYYGVNLLFPSPFPSKVFAEPEAALAWLVRELEARSGASRGGEAAEPGHERA